MNLDNPKRGDIVVFESKKAGKRLVKRVIALPGDVVTLHDNHLLINSEPAIYQSAKSKPQHPGTVTGQETVTLRESIAGYTHLIKLMPGYHSPLQDFGPVTVPDGQYLMMGDNRDNSADYRVFGFVPRGELRGIADRVLFSLNYDHHYMPRSDRVLTPLK